MILLDLLKKIKYLEFVGDNNIEILKLIQFDIANGSENSIMWINDKNLIQAEKLMVGTLICSSHVKRLVINKNVNLIIVDNPRHAFAEILKVLYPQNQIPIISKTAIISTKAKLGSNLFIGENVVIEDDCYIGNNCFINHNTIILRGTILNDNVKVGCNCTIGGVGFGYEKDEDGKLNLIQHIGNVIINEYSEIGNNTCIDKAVIGSTIIGRHTKIDNLVHIAHGVIIGENSLIIANAMVAGSTKIGDNVWIAPSASILNKINISNNSFIGMASLVLKDVAEGDIVAGVPAKSIKK
jgi:UDP-3-O-[3-hydroxymyristoyl] glucosamine N-acyltransferase